MSTKGIGGHQSASSRTDEYVTPLEIIQSLGPFDTDPCSPINRPWPTAKTHYTIEDDGRYKPWTGRVWLNPPYSDITIWIQLLTKHNNGLVLLFNRSDRAEFHDYLFPFAHSQFLVRRRIHFCNIAGMRLKNDCGGPSVFFAFGEENSEKLSQSGMKGRHIALNYTPIIVVGISPTWISVVTIAVNNFGDADLKPVYDMVERIAPDKVANNNYWKEKVRQQIQVIRKKKSNAIIKNYIHEEAL